MSFALDVNILLYASNEESPFHARAREFLESCAEGGEVFCLAWTTVMAYLRIGTHPSIFASPLTPESAHGNLAALFACPHLRMLAEQDGFWEHYRFATQGLVVRGNLVPDAHLAALLRQHGVRTFYSNDLDFRRFDFLDLRNPFA